MKSKLNSALDHIGHTPSIRRTIALFNTLAYIPLSIGISLFAIAWGLLAIATRPFSFYGAEAILRSVIDIDYWSYGVLIIGLIHLFARVQCLFRLYIIAATAQCAIWWLVFTAFLFGGIPSAGVATYGFIAILATVNLMRFDAGIRRCR